MTHEEEAKVYRLLYKATDEMYRKLVSVLEEVTPLVQERYEEYENRIAELELALSIASAER